MLIPFGFMQKVAAEVGGALGAVANLNTWAGVVENATYAFTASPGTNRYLIGIVGMESSTSGQTPPTGATYGGQAMTLIRTVDGTGGWNTSQIWGLKDADFPAGGSQDFIVTGQGGSEAPSLIMGCFEGVNQTTPIDLINGIGSSNTSNNPSTGAILHVNTFDMAIMSFASTSGQQTSGWFGEIAAPHTILVVGGANDPCEAIFRAYTDSDITDGVINVTGGQNNRCPMIGLILSHDGFSVAAQTVLDRMSSLSAIEKVAISTFVDAEVADTNWGKYDEFFCFSLNEADSLTGFISKTATAVNAPIHSLDGYKFNGTTQYIDTNINPSVDGVNYTQDDAWAEVFNKTPQPGEGVRHIFGAYDGSTRVRVQSGQNINMVINSGINLQKTQTQFAANTMVTAHRIGDDIDTLLNGVSIITSSTASTGIPNININIGNSTGIGGQFYDGLISSFGYGGAIGFTQATHNTNHLNLLVDLGVYSQPVLDRFSNLSQVETNAITDFVNQEVKDGNWFLYDEFFCFSLNETDALTGFMSKTATAINAPTHSIEGYAFNGATQHIKTDWIPSVDGVNWGDDDALYGFFSKTVVHATNKIAVGVYDGSKYSQALALASSSRFDINGNTYQTAKIEFDSLYIIANVASGTADSAKKVYKDGVEETKIVGNNSDQTSSTNEFYVGARNNQGTADSHVSGIISSFIVGGGVGFDHVAHNTNHLNLLIDLGIYSQPVLNRFSNLSQIEIDAITDFVNQEVKDGNWLLYDEFFCFSLNETDALIGFKSKTATAVNAPIHSIDGYAFNGTTQYIDTNWNPSTDGVNYKQDDAIAGIFINTIIQLQTQDVFGVLSGNSGIRMRQFTTDTIQNIRLNSSNNPKVDTEALQDKTLYIISKDDNTTLDLYKDGAVLLAGGTATSEALVNGNILLGTVTGTPGFLEGGLYSAIIGGSIGFNQVAHNINHRKLLTDLGVTL